MVSLGPVNVQIRVYLNRRLEMAGSRASSQQIEGGQKSVLVTARAGGARVLSGSGEWPMERVSGVVTLGWLAASHELIFSHPYPNRSHDSREFSLSKKKRKKAQSSGQSDFLSMSFHARIDAGK
jgi:hypothetical protein